MPTSNFVVFSEENVYLFGDVLRQMEMGMALGWGGDGGVNLI